MADTTKIVGAGSAGLAQAAAILRHGGLVAFPTETVYGLGADATDAKAVAALFAAKGRPAFNPLISHVADLDAAEGVARFDRRALAVAEVLWPGPLTLVLPRPEGGGPVCDLACAGLETIAVRVPAHPTARALLQRVGKPVAAPSANRSGRVSPTAPTHVADELAGSIPLILADGRCDVGLESTILDLSGPVPVLLRPGAVLPDILADLLGAVPLSASQASESAPKSPGRLTSHYAPILPVRLNVTAPAADEAFLAFGPDLAPALAKLNLSEDGDFTEAAANLYDHLRSLDRTPGASGIAVAPIPDDGLGAAINDRLRRAAAPRDTVAAS